MGCDREKENREVILNKFELGDLVYLTQENKKIYGRVVENLPQDPSFGKRVMIVLLEPQGPNGSVTHLCAEDIRIAKAMDEFTEFSNIDICSEDNV